MFFPCWTRFFFLLAGQKVDLFAPHGAIKSTLWPASKKKLLIVYEEITDKFLLKNYLIHIDWRLILYHDTYINISFNRVQLNRFHVPIPSQTNSYSFLYGFLIWESMNQQVPIYGFP